jgi:4-hydroxybenzoate polyprenyltransferase
MNFTSLLTISRPRFWLYELGTFTIGVLAGIQLFDFATLLPVFIFGLYFLLPANLLIYGINDVFDYETDLKNPKKFGYEQVLGKELHKKTLIIIALTTLPFVLYSFTLGVTTIVAFFTFLFFAVFYSAPPIRAKTKPLIDSFFSAGHYVATGVFGFLLASGGAGWLPLAIAGMCWAIAMHAYSAVPDIKSDRAVGMKTIAILFGVKGTVLLCGLLYTASAIISSFYIGWISYVLLLPYLYLLGISYGKTSSSLMPIYKKFPLLNAGVGMILTILVLLQSSFL